MKSNTKTLTEGPLAKQIFLVSLPLALSNLLQVLFNMSDVARGQANNSINCANQQIVN